MPWGAVAGAVIGAVGSNMAASKAAKGRSTATSTSEPWIELQPYLQNLYGTGQGLLGRGQQISPRSAWSEQALTGQAMSAQDPNSLIGQAQGQLGATIGGQYLDPSTNPYLRGAVEQAMGQAQRGVSQQFSRENYGSSANQEWLGRHLQGAAAPIYANAYQQERTNQLNALQMAPGLQQANFQQLLGAGTAQEQRGQAELDAPWMAAQRYGQLLGAVGTPSSTSATGQQPYYNNPWAAGLGGGLAGYQLYNNVFGQNPGLFGQQPQTQYFNSGQGLNLSGYGPAFGG